MSYTVKQHPKVVKFLSKCEKPLSDRIKNKFKLLEKEPFRYLEQYQGQDFYKLRIGDYRALVDVDTSQKLILIRFLDHRSKIYKRT